MINIKHLWFTKDQQSGGVMNIAPEQAEKLGKYFLNADPFLWGVLVAKNKKERLQELKQMGFLTNYAPGGNPVYTKICRDLLLELGIEGILSKIVVPKIQSIFDQEILRYFRDCWGGGQTPDLKFLVKNKLYRPTNIFLPNEPEKYDDWSHLPPVVGYRDPAFIFVQINVQHNFIERWTVFAGLWFEEIQRLLH
jgi:hypothetical protein